MAIPQEIERKFLLAVLPTDLNYATRRELRQGYLCMENDREVRVRTDGDLHEMTFKQGAGVVRTEINIPLSAEQFDLLWPLTAGRQLVKDRYYYPLDSHTVEIDVYRQQLAPLIVAEVEFGSEQAAQKFSAPAFFGTEITSDYRFKNSRLAQLELPPVIGN